MSAIKGEEPTISGEQSPTPEPWATEGAERAGAGPMGEGQPGERGSSAFTGDRATDERGPNGGVEYFKGNPGLADNGTGVREHSLEQPTATNGTQQ